MRGSYLRLVLLGFGFMGISLLWGIYNAYVPIFLQAGRPGFSTSAGVAGFGLGTTLTGFIMTLDNLAALFIFTSFAVNALQVNSGQATSIGAFFALSIILFAVPGGWLGAKVGRRRAIQLAIMTFALLLICGHFVHTVWQARLLLAASGVVWAVIVVNSLPMVVDCAPPSRTGAYAGLYYLASQSSAIVGPILAGKIIAIFNNDYRVIFLYGAGGLGIAFAFMLGVRRGEALIFNR